MFKLSFFLAEMVGFSARACMLMWQNVCLNWDPRTLKPLPSSQPSTQPLGPRHCQAFRRRSQRLARPALKPAEDSQALPKLLEPKASLIKQYTSAEKFPPPYPHPPTQCFCFKNKNLEIR